MTDEAALVLFSGGQDSATCLAWALDRYAQNPETSSHAAIFAGLMLHAPTL